MRMIGIVFLILLSAGMIIIALANPEWPSFVRWMLGIVAAAILFYAAMATLEWATRDLLPAWDEHTIRLAEARAITTESQYLHELSRLTPQQTEVWLKRFTSAVAMPGVAGATLLYDVDGVQIPAEFVTEFLSKCGDEYLYPVRRYADGTSGRKWSTALTDFYVKRGLARPAVGSTPAAWNGRNKSEAIQWFSLMEEG